MSKDERRPGPGKKDEMQRELLGHITIDHDKKKVSYEPIEPQEGRFPVADCVVCMRHLYTSPTELGWARVRHSKGLCFDCIDSYSATMLAHRKAEATNQKD